MLRICLFVPLMTLTTLYAQLSQEFFLPKQSWEDFSGEERAFFYRIARTTDILQTSVFPIFEFTDSIPWINDTLADYKYVENQIIGDKKKLVLHTSEVPRISNGLIADLALHYALWDMGRVLHFRKSTDPKDADIPGKIHLFEKYILETVPASAVDRKADGTYDLRYQLPTYFSPSLNCNDRMAAMKNSGYIQLDQMLCVNAIYYAMEKYVTVRTAEIFRALGGTNNSQRNYLSAAGDGANYSDLEEGYKPTPQTSTLPENNGLFRFFINEEAVPPKAVNEKPTNEKMLRVEDVVIREFKTNSEKSTVLHFDVHNWHKQRQTTVVIQKGGKSYILFGNNDNRLLSPDSTFGEGSTYRRLIWELEKVHIADLRLKLYGKRGYEYWIKEFEAKIQKTLLKIKKTEFKLDQLRHTPQVTPKIKKKKWRKIDLTGSDQAGQGHPTDGLTKTQKKMQIEQNRLIFLEGQLDAERKELARLKREMEEAYFLLVAYENKLDRMQKNLGLLEMPHTKSGDFYVFGDGASFNRRTQDFTFAGQSDVESFQVLHICFGEKVFSETKEENFVHIQESTIADGEKFALHRVLRDRMDSKMTPADSLQLLEVYKALADEDLDVELYINAGGIIGENTDGTFFRKESLSPVPYADGAVRTESATVFHAECGANLRLDVTVWLDQMLPKDFVSQYPKFAKWKAKNPSLNEIDYLCGLQAVAAFNQLLEEMIDNCPKWTKNAAEQKRILDKLSTLKAGKVYYADGKILAKGF